MSSAASSLVNKVWNYCNLVCYDGASYGDYVDESKRDPAILAAEIVEDLQAALDQFAQIASDLSAGDTQGH
jgi:hypothetical protein